jgi:hypothetical protein
MQVMGGATTKVMMTGAAGSAKANRWQRPDEICSLLVCCAAARRRRSKHAGWLDGAFERLPPQQRASTLLRFSNGAMRAQECSECTIFERGATKNQYKYRVARRKALGGKNPGLRHGWR